MTTARTLLTDQMRRRLVSARKAKGVSQTLLAEYLGCTRVYLCYLEKGRSQPSFEMLNNWCTTLGLTLKVEIE